MYPKPEHGKGILHASVWDITSRPASDETLPTLADTSQPATPTYSLPEGIEPGTVDVITVIYVLSALHPNEWEQAIHNLWTVCRSAPSPSFADGNHRLLNQTGCS
jgi:tRNAThr (cytosine32-N3)-methyltransferase